MNNIFLCIVKSYDFTINAPKKKKKKSMKTQIHFQPKPNALKIPPPSYPKKKKKKIPSPNYSQLTFES